MLSIGKRDVGDRNNGHVSDGQRPMTSLWRQCRWHRRQQHGLSRRNKHRFVWDIILDIIWCTKAVMSRCMPYARHRLNSSSYNFLTFLNRSPPAMSYSNNYIRQQGLGNKEIIYSCINLCKGSSGTPLQYVIVYRSGTFFYWTTYMYNVPLLRFIWSVWSICSGN